MTADRWTRIKALFAEAADLAPAERAAFLDREADGADPDLRAEVEAMLASDGDASTFFDGFAGRASAPPPAVGPWRLTERVGEGGMGEVWRAERADGAYTQVAAVKLARPALGADVLARFRAERQLLAGLDHPAIARLLDGGRSGDGRPYFALEFVRGRPITAYADRHRLGVDSRLALFLDVCDAVAYAHGRGIVHRDLKPSNVLVADDDEAGTGARVKLLDFGIAKLLDGGAEATQTGRRLLTPAYAAPEQVSGGAVSPATDVYALGVLLYELLTGARPSMGAATRPSEAVTTSAPVADRVTGLTGPTPEPDRAAADRLRRRLRGDLDHIVLRALALDPADRYASAQALADDVRRHLDGLPVVARSGSVPYRAARYAWRHRAALVAAGLVAVLAVSYALTARSQAARVVAERDRAEAVSAFMTSLVGEFDPNRSAGGTLEASAVLDRAVARVRDELGGQPDVQARLLDALGQIYQSYARFDEAEGALSEALAVRRALYGPAHDDIGETLHHLGWLAHVRGDYDQADSLYTAAREAYRAGDGPGRVAGEAGATESLGLIARVRGDLATAERRLRTALDARADALGEDSPEWASNANALAAVLAQSGRPDEAEVLFRAVVDRHRRVLGDHSHTAQALHDYAALEVSRGRYAEAAALYTEALAIRRALLGDDHPHVAQSLSHVGWSLQSQGAFADAEPYYREALAIRRAAFGDDHAAVANSQLMLGETLVERGQVDDGVALIAQAVRAMRRVLGRDDPGTRSAELRLAERLAAAGREAEAADLARRALPRLQEVYGAGSEKAARAEALLGPAAG